MWTLRQYEDAAAKIGRQFVESGGEQKINDMSAKIAQDAGLNPDGIRTLVRLANVSAFEQTFEKRSKDKAEDRMIEFEVGQPEAVINQLYKDAQENTVSASEKTASDYNRQLDYYGDLTKEREPLEKTASAIPGVEIAQAPQRGYSAQEVRYAFDRAQDRMKERAKQAEFRWMDCLEKVARTLVARDSRTAARTAFEKDAASLLGEDILPELKAVRMLTSPKNSECLLFDGEKVASITTQHIANVSPEDMTIMNMLKEAHDARVDAERCKAGIKWVVEHTPGVSNG